MTLPMSFGDAAPASATASATIALQLLVGDLLGQVGLDQLGVALGLAGQLVAAALAEGLGRLQPPLALALEHRHLVVAALLGGLLELGQHHPQRAGALAVARLQRGVGVGLQLVEHRH